MADILAKMQPIVGPSALNVNAEDVLIRAFPGQPKKIKTCLLKATKTQKKCGFCGCKCTEQSPKHSVIQFAIDWEDREYSPSKLVTCCADCYKLSVYSEAMGIYVRESLQKSSEGTGELSNLVSHFLRANKLKVSHINVFYGAISVAVSLRTSLASLGVDFSVVSPPSDLESFVSSLVSSSA